MRWWVLGLWVLVGCDDGDGGDPADGAGSIDGAIAEDQGGSPADAAAPDAAPPECVTSDDCLGDRILCHEGRCVGCLGDGDCVLGTVCAGEICVEGCSGDARCPAGTICGDGGRCVEGCRDDEACDAGQICDEDACVSGCRDDAVCGDQEICVDALCVGGCRGDGTCPPGQICEEAACVEGCRDDAGCAPEGLCLEATCRPLGVACREDAHCGEGDRCDVEAARCVPAAMECPPDAHEPDDAPEMAPVRAPGRYADLRICPGDVDRSAVDLEVGDQLDVLVEFAAANGALEVTVQPPGDDPVASMADPAGARLRYEARVAGPHVLVVRGADAMVRNGYVLTIEVTAPPMCMDTALYADGDGDGFGEGAPMNACLLPDEVREGFARQGGDCGPADAWRNPDAEEICSDWVDDDCDGRDAACPETRPGLAVPDWDCTGDPPANVVAWARFADGGGYFHDGGCFVFFEGAPEEFYVQRRLTRANDDPGCEARNGCTCPSLNGWPSYDRRLYALTLAGAADACAELSIRDHGGEDQPVSNACRKYLYQLHFYDIPYSWIAGSRASLERRLALFPTVEIACIEDAPHANLPFQSLLTAAIQRNPGFVPAE